MPTKTDTPDQPKAPEASDDLVFINVAIPTELHRKLRIRQITDGVVMRVVVTDALRAWLD
jgi:hypothetical protein